MWCNGLEFFICLKLYEICSVYSRRGTYRPDIWTCFYFPLILSEFKKKLSFYVQFDTQFEPYLKYCMEESSCTKYFKQKQSEDELFKLYVEVSWGCDRDLNLEKCNQAGLNFTPSVITTVHLGCGRNFYNIVIWYFIIQTVFTLIYIFSTQWCENRPECKRLKLSDLLVKPMQRLTKYPLLLKAILKKTVDEDKRKETTSMVGWHFLFLSKKLYDSISQNLLNFAKPISKLFSFVKTMI